MSSAYRILMVDDTPEQAEQMASVFTQLPEVTEFVTARHAAQALQTIESRPLDLILMDQQWTAPDLPNDYLTDLQGELPARERPESHRQGFGIMRYLRSADVRLPIVFATAVAEQNTALEAVEAGATNYFSKQDLLAHPEFALQCLSERPSDHGWLQRKLQQGGFRADRMARDWFVAKRSEWRRQWAWIAEALLDQAAGLGYSELNAQTIHKLDCQVLPRLLQDYKETVTERSLREALAACDIDVSSLGPFHYLEPFWLTVTASNALFMLLEPEALASDRSFPQDWQDTINTWRQHLPGIAQVTWQYLSMGPQAPFWGCSVLLTLTTAEGQWRLDTDTSQPGRRPLPLLAGLWQAPGAVFYAEAEPFCRALTALDSWSTRAASIAPLFAIDPDAATLHWLPFPRRMLKPDIADRLGRQPLQQLLYLNRGVPVSAKLTGERLERAIRKLPKVEVWRCGWPYPFEEETLDKVMEVLAAHTNEGPFTLWLASEFAHFQSQNRLRPRIREYDLVLLAPQGLCLLECKASTLERDMRGGHWQVKEAREQLWASAAGGRRPVGSVLLDEVLLQRLERFHPKQNFSLPQDLLAAAPPALRTELHACQNKTQAKDTIRNYYARLRQVFVKPSFEVNPDFLKPKNRKEIPAVVGFVVIPTTPAQNRREGKTHNQDVQEFYQNYVVTLNATLPERLEAWLNLPPVLDPTLQSQVRHALMHTSHGVEMLGQREFGGFTTTARQPGIGPWQVYLGHAAWSDRQHQPQTLLCRSAKKANLNQRDIYGQWLTTALRELSGHMAWLDVRGLPADQARDIHDLAIIVQGEILSPGKPGKGKGSLTDCLADLNALFKLGRDANVATVLGLSTDPPLPLLQRLPGTTRRRPLWLPGEPLRHSHAQTPAQNQGWCYLLEVLEQHLPVADYPWLEPLGKAMQQALSCLRDRRKDSPSLDPVADLLDTAKHWAYLTEG